jgi:hypothetical protein
MAVSRCKNSLHIHKADFVKEYFQEDFFEGLIP